MVAALSVAHDNVHCFYYSDQNYIWLIQTLFKELGLENKRVCLWLKQSQNPTPQIAFSKCYEPCTYALRGRPYIAKNIQNLNEVMNGEMTTGNDLFDQVSDHLDIWAVRESKAKKWSMPLPNLCNFTAKQFADVQKSETLFSTAFSDQPVRSSVLNLSSEEYMEWNCNQSM